MRNIVLINGSPKTNDESTSKCIVDMVEKCIDEFEVCKTFINIRQSMSNHKTRQDFETLSNADAIIIVFPLYVFCMPGILTRFLEDYHKFYVEQGKFTRNAKVYAIVNCGFPEPEINLDAVRVIKSFCKHINAKFRFGVLIGGGGMLQAAKKAPFMKKTVRSLESAFLTIAKDIQSNDFNMMDNVNIRMNFPRWLYLFMGDIGWVSMARKNGLRKKDLYRKPYM